MQRIHLELDDLNAMVAMLNEEFNFSYSPDPDRIDAKKSKVNRYAKHSEKLGLVKSR